MSAPEPDDRVDSALAAVLAAFEVQRHALLAGDVEEVQCATQRLETLLGQLRHTLPREPAAHRPGQPERAGRLQAWIPALMQAAKANNTLLLRRAAITRAAVEQLAQDAPRLARRAIGATYAPVGAMSTGEPLTRDLGSA